MEAARTSTMVSTYDSRRAVADRLDEAPEERRCDEPGGRSERMEHDDARRARHDDDRRGGAHGAAARARRRWAGALSLALASRDDVAIRRRRAGAARDASPPRPTRPSSTRTTRSARSSTSGLVVTITVVRPARAPRRSRAMRASVWASTALVGSTSTRISGSARRARARTSRCRCPPENDRPRSSIVASRPVRQRVEHVLRVRDRQRLEDGIVARPPDARGRAGRAARPRRESAPAR